MDINFFEKDNLVSSKFVGLLQVSSRQKKPDARHRELCKENKDMKKKTQKYVWTKCGQNNLMEYFSSTPQPLDHRTCNFFQMMLKDVGI